MNRYYLTCCLCELFFFFKQKTAYEMRISDWSSDVCSSDLVLGFSTIESPNTTPADGTVSFRFASSGAVIAVTIAAFTVVPGTDVAGATGAGTLTSRACAAEAAIKATRSEEHTSELQSLMRISYAVFCLKTKKYMN